jgi:glutathione S-transferase
MVNRLLLTPEFTMNLSFIEQQLKTSGGDYLCGKDIAAADYMLGFALESCMIKDAGQPLTKEKYPLCVAYVERLQAREAWQRALAKVEQAEKEAEQK